MSREVVKEIKELKDLKDDFKGKFYTLYAFYRRLVRDSPTIWELVDSSDIVGIEILINNVDASYPKPQIGDIVRIHRLGFNKKYACPECIVTRNILIWSAFQKNPTKFSTARKFSYTQIDDTKRKYLELEFYHSVHKIENIFVEPVSLKSTFISLAARIIDRHKDEKFGNVLLRLVDGTLSRKPIESYYKLIPKRQIPLNIIQSSIVLLVYSKQNEKEKSNHHEKALSTSIGDYIYVSQVKLTIYNNNQLRFYLSANDEHERTFRLVEPESVIGLKIKSECSKNFPQLQEFIDTYSTDSQTNPSVLETTNNDLSLGSTHESEQVNSRNGSQTKLFIQKLNQIEPVKLTYRFIDLVARVVSSKNLEPYNNHLLLIEDGSSFEYKGFGIQEFTICPDLDLTNKATVLIYEKKYFNETDAHINVARDLLPGDFVLIVNAKVSWAEGRIKIEVNANLDHGKSLKILSDQHELVRALGLNSEENLVNFEECFEQPSMIGRVEE